MSSKTKALLYNFICFAIIFIIIRILLEAYSNLQGLWLPVTAFIVSTIVSPKFQSVNTSDGDKIFMKWMFIKGIKRL